MKHSNRASSSLMCGIIVVLIMLTGTARGVQSATPVDLGTLGGENICAGVEYLFDPEKRYAFSDITRKDVSSKFILNTRDNLDFSIETRVCWVRFNVSNPIKTDIKWLLEIAYPPLDIIELYIPDGEGRYSVRKSGDTLPFASREFSANTFVFPITSGRGITTIYLRAETDGNLNLPLRRWSESEFRLKESREHLINFTTLGILFIIGIYNLMIFLAARRKEMDGLWFSLMTLCFAFNYLTMTGYGFQFFWPNAMWFNGATVPFALLVFLFLAFFIKDFLNTAKTVPRWMNVILSVYRYLTMLELLFYVIFLASGRPIPLILSRLFYVWLLMTGLVMIFSMPMAFVSAKWGKNRAGWIYLVSFTPFLIIMAWLVVGFLRIIPPLPDAALRIAPICMIVLLSVGISDKLNVMKRHLESLNKDLEKNEKIARGRAAYLEELMDTVSGMSKDLVALSAELSGMAGKLSELSQEQSSASEEMSALFEELAASNETVYKSTVDLKEEGIKTKKLVEMLDESQRTIARATSSALASIAQITSSTRETGSTLEEMTGKMSIIESGGKAIGEFMVMIDAITDRVNLLSLNAAIEAARAGVHGKGFAVVADEIGKLATATADNSKEISERIGAIIKDISEGIRIVNVTNGKIISIVNSTASISSNIDEFKVLMDTQTGAITDAVDQAKVIESFSKIMESSIKEQRASIGETMKMIERLSEMAQEMNYSNLKIAQFSRTIDSKINVLNEAAKGFS
ncbi:MAG: hypothetical protein EPN93_16605 [Spirochaetes bacterium]|nr:MAG: hypothetical protein EPN93_16605 [Spirochaetota bacterium]